MLLSPQLTLAVIGLAAFITGALLTFILQQRRIAELRHQYDSARADLHSQQLEAREVSLALEAARENLAATQQRADGISAGLEEERQANQTLRQQRATDTEQLSGLRRELEAQHESSRQQLEDLRSQLAETRDTLKQQQAGSDELSAELTTLKSTLSDRESRLESREKALQETKKQLETTDAELRQQRQDAQRRLDELHKELAETQKGLGSAQTDLKATDENLKEARTQRDTAQATLRELQDTHHALKKTHGEALTRIEEKEAQFKRQLQWMEESKKQLKVEFENLANELLEQKGKAFSSLSERNLKELLQPFQTEIKGFREKVETLHTQETEQRANLRTELKHLQQLNRDITDQASQLTEALKGQKKVQGNWGELMLENVLDSAGLRPGEDYQRERSFNTDEGKRRPDALVYLPQGRHLVIDAKTSLAAYLEYVNAEDELTSQKALADHARAVSARIEELADKHYYDLPGLNSPEVVVMFIPVESAYIEALRHDSTLYQRAIERNVLVATPTTLLTSLNIVSQLWRFENQSRHSAELARKAERFYNKLASFLESMQDVGKKLDGARVSYDKALGQLVNGKGNLIKQATEFQELGVAVKKELPAELVDRARLEVGVSQTNSEHLADQDTREKQSLQTEQ